MDPRLVGEVVSNCVLVGSMIWLAVVGGASWAGLAVLWESVRGEDSPGAGVSARDGRRAAGLLGEPARLAGER